MPSLFPPFARYAIGMLFICAVPLNAADEIGPALKLDHFKLYRVKPVKAEVRVSLKGQFDKEPVSAQLTAIALFANPVIKDRGKLINRMAHLTGYRLGQRQMEPKRQITLENQFGKQEIIIHKPVALLVPTEKIERGSSFPRRLDHYKVYAVIESKPVEKKVTLRDQFAKEDGVKIGRTMFFAVPVSKRHDRRVSRIINEKGHLTIYGLSPRKPYKLTKKTSDQFGKHTLEIIASSMLAVPSFKQRVKVLKD